MSWESRLSEVGELLLDAVPKGSFVEEEASDLELSVGPQDHTTAVTLSSL